MKKSLCCLMVDFFNQLQATSNASFFSIFFNQLERQATIFDKQNQSFRMKKPLPIAPPLPLGKLDNNLSPRVGDFAQKNHPRSKLPGGTLGDTLGDTLDTSIKPKPKNLTETKETMKTLHFVICL